MGETGLDFFRNLSSYENQIDAFEQQMSYWQEDYPALEKYYIFQTRDCNCGTYFNGRKEIKEASIPKVNPIA